MAAGATPDPGAGHQVIGFLAWRSLVRHRARTALCLLGLGISTALLYDMALLATGLRASLARVLDEIGYELRVLPKGGLPFATEASLPNAQALAHELEAEPGVSRALPLFATTLYLERVGSASEQPMTSFALGLDPEGQTLYSIERGEGLPEEEARSRASAARGSVPASGSVPANGGVPASGRVPAILINERVATELGASPGDTLFASVGLEAASGRAARPARVVVAGVAHFRFDLRTQRTVTMRLVELQRLAGREAEAPAAFLIGKLAPGGDAQSIVRRFQARHPETDVLSVADLLDQVRGQLSYFQQFSRVLGSVSLIVTFLLVFTLLTLSVNERQGEIAILRAVGLAAGRVVGLIVLEGLVLVLLAFVPGLALGSLAARGLDAILKSSPGLPPDLSFFVFTPAALARTAVLVIATGAVAGAYPALLAARTNVAATLHREVT